MRLLHTSTIELHEFSSDAIPKYAILSHTWGNDEFLFSDFQKEKSARPEGYHKVLRCCELAASEGWQYVWIDTCCIDKSSSSELNESINSMYKWYKNSAICYVYLSDFSLKYPSLSNAFQESRWFRRGWTLQELLAPGNLVFFDKHWAEIGSKKFLEERLSQICKISKPHLQHPTSASIAARMSWASFRETSREEDLAYSLLGLFNIHMPLIYGEGANAFRRLQLEIIASSDDESIFAWKDPQLLQSGLLARHPAAFEGSGDILPVNFPTLQRSPYHMSNKGLSIGLKSSNQDKHEKNVMWCPLNCTRSADRLSPIVLSLQTNVGGQQTCRVNPSAVQDRSGSQYWRGLKEVHLFISETYVIRSDWRLRGGEAKNWLPLAIRLMPTLENLIWVEDLRRKSSFAVTSDALTFIPAHHAFDLDGTMIVKIQSHHGTKAVLVWANWRSQQSHASSRPLPNVSLYSAAAGEELVMKTATFGNLVNGQVYCRDLENGNKRTPEPMRLEASCNATIPRTDGTFLWLRTREACGFDSRGHRDDWRMVIDISITSVDQSKI